jgi:hypothetical protein
MAKDKSEVYITREEIALLSRPALINKLGINSWLAPALADSSATRNDKPSDWFPGKIIKKEN